MRCKCKVNYYIVIYRLVFLSALCDVKFWTDDELGCFFLLKYVCRTIARKPTAVAVTMNVTTIDTTMGVAVLDSASVVEISVRDCPVHGVHRSARKWF